jgi:hypothetical protein
MYNFWVKKMAGYGSVCLYTWEIEARGSFEPGVQGQPGQQRDCVSRKAINQYI